MKSHVMNNLLKSCFLFLSLIFLTNKTHAQAFAFTVTPQQQCYTGPGNYTAAAAIVATSACAPSSSYLWTVTTTGTCQPTWTTSPNNQSIAITVNCCGEFIVTCFAYQNLPPGPPAAPCDQTAATFTVFCPTSPSPINGPSTACYGEQVTLTAGGAQTYTWNYASTCGAAASFTGNPLVTTATCSTTYTAVGTTTSGCIITSTHAVGVQHASITASANNYSLCPGAPVQLSSNSGVVTNTNYLPGTVITGLQWLEPPAPGTPIGSLPTINTPAVGGSYSVVLTHTGIAGTCTNVATVQINTLSTINVSVIATPANLQVCPGSVISLTAISIQTASSSYTWTAPPTANRIFTAAPVVPTCYTVDVTYFGCTGQSVVCVGMASLTPTLTASSPSICPGTNLTLTASGGVNYTFVATPPAAPAYTIAKPLPTTSVVTTSPGTSTNFPIQYCVNSTSAGCTGTTCIVVDTLIMPLVLTPSSMSVCPGTAVTLCATGGAGSTYTFQSLVTQTIGVAGTPSSCVVYTPFGLPDHVLVTIDSAGCKGVSSLVTIDTRTIVPRFLPDTISSCVNNIYSLTVSGGAGTSYTFVAPTGTVPPTMTVTGNTAVHSATSLTTPLDYTVHVDSAGCIGTGIGTVIERTLFPVLSASSPSICPGTQFTLNSTGGSGTTYTFSASYSVSPGSSVIPIPSNTVNTAIHTPTAIPPQTYFVQTDSLGCKGTASIQVGLLGLSPQLTLTASSPSVCPGTQFTLTGSGSNATYSFFAPPSNTLANTSSNTAVHSNTNILGGATYTVAADSAGCTGTATVMINQMFLNNLGLVGSSYTVCAGMPVTLTANSPGLSGATYTFAVIPPSTPTVVSIGSSSMVIVSPTVQTVYAVIADSAGCTSPIPPGPQQIKTITMAPGLVITAAASSASVCSGTAATLSVAGPTDALYSWFDPNGPISTPSLSPPNTSIVISPTVNTVYTVTAVNPTTGCVGESTVEVGIDPTAQLSLSLTSNGSTLCPGQSATLTASGALSYSWAPPGGLNTIIGPTVITTPSVSTTYTVTGSNNAGCYGTVALNVPMSSFPVMTVVPTASAVCPGFNSTLTAFGAISYTWTGTSFTNAISQQSVAVGPGNYKVVGSNGGGCIDSTTASVGIAPPLTINVSQLTGTTCIEKNNPKYSKPVGLSASGAGTYVWFPYNPIYMTYSLGPSTTVRPPASTCFTVTGATSICSGTAVVCVTVIPQFTMNVIPPLPAMCLGDSIKLNITNVSTLAVGPVSAFTYSWTEALNAPPISINNNLSPTVTVFPRNTTTYTVEVFDSRSCVSLPRLVTVTVLPRPETAISIPTINSVPTNTVCFVGLNPGAVDNIITLTGTNKNTNLQFGIVPTYTWYSPYKAPYLSILTSPNSNAVTVNAPLRLLDGSSVVTYTLESGYNGVAGCRRIDTVSVRVIDCRPITTVSFTTADDNDTICVRQCITFVNLTDTMAGGPQKLRWQFDGGAPAESDEQFPTVCYNLPGKYNVILTAENPYPVIRPDGSSGSAGNLGVLGYIRVVDIPNVTIFSPGQLASDTTIQYGRSVRLNASGALTYDWFPDYRLQAIDGEANSVIVSPLRNTQYILTGYNGGNCYSSDTVNVFVIEGCGEMFIPSAFSPNNDGHNDVLKVRGQCLQNMTLMIFNRWGEKVFETNDQNLGWDGTYKGHQLNTGVFVYRLEGRTFEGEAVSLKGNLTLIR